MWIIGDFRRMNILIYDNDLLRWHTRLHLHLWWHTRLHLHLWWHTRLHLHLWWHVHVLHIRLLHTRLLHTRLAIAVVDGASISFSFLLLLLNERLVFISCWKGMCL